MENMKIFDEVRAVPKTAQKAITGGRLNGMTDINPMWRIETLTKEFGPCGIGWKYEIASKVLEPGANGEVAALVDLNLFIKVDGEWSAAIPGTGGSMYIANEKAGARTSDEAFKMATTDALSVACKMLGIGADIYWAQGANTAKPETKKETPKPQTKYENTPPSVGSDDLPDPKAKASTKSDANVEELRKIAIPSDVEGFGGKTIGEVADTDIESLRSLAALVSDKALRNNIVKVYNAMIVTKKSA